MNTFVALGAQPGHTSIIPDINFKLPPAEFQRKHPGKYGVVSKGEMQWSCCLGKSADMTGCSDDHSVGVKDTLVVKPRVAYRPFTATQSFWHSQKVFERARYHRPASFPQQMNKGFRDLRPLTHQHHQRDGNFYNCSSTSGGMNESILSPVKSSVISGAHTELRDHIASITSPIKGTPSRPSTVGWRQSSGNSHDGPTVSWAPAISRSSLNTSQASESARNAPQDCHTTKSDIAMSASIARELSDSFMRPPAAFSSARGKKGTLRARHGLDIHRAGGRPLTAPWGAHLSMPSTVSPATSLDHICQRIV